MRGCIIPARKGSKRIKDKNIKEFCGKPILEYPLREALSSALFLNPYVFTNDERILEKYTHYAVPRLDDNANEHSTLAEMLFECLMKDTHYEYVCVLLPTAVFATKEDLIKSFDMLKDNDAVISVCKYNHPIERALGIYHGSLIFFNKTNEFTRTQDLLDCYHDAGQFYWLKTKSFLQQKRIFMDKSVPYIMDAVDIDTEEDWLKAEAIFEKTYKL